MVSKGHSQVIIYRPTMDFSYHIESTVNCERQALWQHVTQMKNVNYELLPYARMTYPDDRTALAGNDVPLNTVLFKSLILLFGFIPADLHYLRLERIVPGEAFYENSTTLTHRYWKHTRTLSTIDAHTTMVRDEVHFAPRLPLLGHVFLPIYRGIFANRHRKLQGYFR